jgi:hypothetical protein
MNRLIALGCVLLLGGAAVLWVAAAFRKGERATSAHLALVPASPLREHLREQSRASVLLREQRAIDRLVRRSREARPTHLIGASRRVRGGASRDRRIRFPSERTRRRRRKPARVGTIARPPARTRRGAAQTS